jgi:hypothetical protein
MHEMKNLTTSVYTFEKLIEGNYSYIDKTEYIWNLIKEPYGIYFLSRPRRFGKSLTLSTLKAVFQNKKHLFKGLALENKPHAWKEYPVIHLDLGDLSSASPELLNASLTTTINEAASALGIELKNSGASERFRELILQSSKKEKVVILIDEYDKPILDNVVKANIESIREVLENFYSVVKATEPYQRFVLLTGVSKFARVSVFSKLNNLTDITMDARFATMLGYTQEELEANFAEHIEHVCREQKMDKTDLLVKLKLWYDGYKFHQNAEPVYNPVSIGKFFESGGEFKNYWFETGTPTFLIDLLKKYDYNLDKLDNYEAVEDDFSTYEVGQLQVLPLLVQTGYLTIIKAFKKFDSLCYILDFPNREVRESFNRRLAQSYSNLDGQVVTSHLFRLLEALSDNDLGKFFKNLGVFFANVPYGIQVKHEHYYQSIFHVVFTLIGVNMESESVTDKGRIDAVVKTDKYVYIFEFKLNRSATEALKQIHDKEYYQKYLGSGREIILIGAKFSTKKRNIAEWKTEVLNLV